MAKYLKILIGLFLIMTVFNPRSELRKISFLMELFDFILPLIVGVGIILTNLNIFNSIYKSILKYINYLGIIYMLIIFLFNFVFYDFFSLGNILLGLSMCGVIVLVCMDNIKQLKSSC